MTKKVDRRSFIKYTAAGVVVLAGAAGGYYFNKSRLTSTPITIETAVKSTNSIGTSQSPTETTSSTISKSKFTWIHSDDYDVELIMPTAFGLPFQFALLPNGDIAIGDWGRNRILLFREGEISPLISGDYINAWAVASLPDGRIVYATYSGEIKILDYVTGEEENLGRTPNNDRPLALAADAVGNVYTATSHNNLYRFNREGKREVLILKLPFPDTGFAVSDVDVASDGTVYVAGSQRVVAVNNGKIQTVADGLHQEPVWVEIAPDGCVYINDAPGRGLLRFDPQTKQLVPLKVVQGFGDMLALTAEEFFFYDSHGIFFKLNIQTNLITSLFVNAGNSFAFAAGADDKVFFATPPLNSVLKQHMVCMHGDGTRVDLPELEYSAISSADVDKENRLNLLTEKGLIVVENDGSTEIVKITFPSERQLPWCKNMAVGPDGKWYMITSDFNDKIEVLSVDNKGHVRFLPLSFNRQSFGDAYRVSDARIDVASDGSLALFITAVGSVGSGPCMQRVFLANADGSNLRQIAQLDSSRIGGMVDIAFGLDNDLFVLTVQGGEEKGFFADPIYRIDKNRKVTEAIYLDAGRDPKSIDVDPAGNIWFSTTLGIFKAQKK